MKHKILFVGTSVSGGGAERVFINIINSIDPDRYDVKVFYTCYEEISNINDIIPITFANKLHMREALTKLVTFIKEFQPDSVFTSHSSIAYMLPILRFWSGIKFKIYTRVAVTPSEIYHDDLKSRILYRIYPFLYRIMDLIIAQTDYMKKDIIKNYGVKGEKIRVIRNIIQKEYVLAQSKKEISEFISKDDYNIVAAGALYSVKGFDLLIKALAPVIKENRKIKLRILGEERYEIGYKSILQSMIQRLDLSDNIMLLGHKQNPYPYIMQSDLYVMSSKREGFPNVVLEALCLGTPVVATDCVDFTDVIFAGINGFITKKEDVDSIRQGIKSAMSQAFDVRSIELKNFDYNTLFI